MSPRKLRKNDPFVIGAVAILVVVFCLALFTVLMSIKPKGSTQSAIPMSEVEQRLRQELEQLPSLADQNVESTYLRVQPTGFLKPTGYVAIDGKTVGIIPITNSLLARDESGRWTVIYHNTADGAVRREEFYIEKPSVDARIPSGPWVPSERGRSLYIPEAGWIVLENNIAKFVAEEDK
jgi:hypothetical protein